MLGKIRPVLPNIGKTFSARGKPGKRRVFPFHAAFRRRMMHPMRATALLSPALLLATLLSRPAGAQTDPTRTAAVSPAVELSALFDAGFPQRDAETLRTESRGLLRPDGEGLLRFATSPARPAATLFGVPVLEALVRFSPSGAPARRYL